MAARTGPAAGRDLRRRLETLSCLSDCAVSRRIAAGAGEDRPEFHPEKRARGTGTLDSLSSEGTAPGTGTIVLSASGFGGRTESRILDRGPGIPDSRKDQVYTPFQRLGHTDNDTGSDSVWPWLRASSRA
ncbi:hypothetical protein [Arthrobacter zhaoguopingii]|uniref:hypothetical protein n=1 Tax=Arthrobacter zhaoguopingii TaxID=2681491 RepID=UPI00135753B8|nr:hypothetical protein [Arthrobacter zhaoguopingii]